MNHSKFDNNNGQFVVSQELLQLFRWLFEREQDELRKLVARSLRNGLQENLYYRNNEIETNEELEHTVIDFFQLLEAFMFEILTEADMQKIVQRNLMPTIDQIDSKICDDKTVAISAAKATSMLESNPCEDPKIALCKELLKRWKPSKKISMH